MKWCQDIISFSCQYVVNCRMRFYYRYVNRLKEPWKDLAISIPRCWAVFCMRLWKHLFKKYVGQVINTEMLNALVTNRQKLLQLSGKQWMKNLKEVIITIYWNELIVRECPDVYLIRIWYWQSIYTIHMLGVEEPCSFRMTLNIPDDTEAEVITGGRIDRIDIKGRGVRMWIIRQER